MGISLQEGFNLVHRCPATCSGCVFRAYPVRVIYSRYVFGPSRQKAEMRHAVGANYLAYVSPFAQLHL